MSLIGQRIVRALSEPIVLPHGNATIGVSVGAAVSNGTDGSVHELIAHVDAAMYEAKHAGKGRVELFGEELDSRLTERRELGSDLRLVLERNELELCYRSVASLTTGDIAGLEASVRWNHPTRGLLPPDTFIPVASTTGMIEQIDEWVLAAAAADIASWRSDHPELVAWITLSGRQLTQSDGARRILAILAEANADAAEHRHRDQRGRSPSQLHRDGSRAARAARRWRLHRARQLLRTVERRATASPATGDRQARPWLPEATRPRRGIRGARSAASPE